MVGVSVANVKRDVEEQQLSQIAQYVAVESMRLTSNAPAANVTSTVTLDIPPLVGNQRYWVQIKNDTTRAWVEAGFGTTVTSSAQRAYIPAEVAASGSYISGSPTASLEYSVDGAGAHLALSGGE